jgi:hypothetical protein
VLFPANLAFTGICVLNAEKGPKGILFHSGDSFLMEIDLQHRSVRTLTRDDFHMTGRTKIFSQVEVLDAGSRLYHLGTDGFSRQELPGKRDDFLLGLFESQGVERIADTLLDSFAGSRTGDDIALLGLNPAKLPLHDDVRTRLIMGGTSSGEEERIQSFFSADYSDWYQPHGSFSLKGAERMR